MEFDHGKFWFDYCNNLMAVGCRVGLHKPVFLYSVIDNLRKARLLKTNHDSSPFPYSRPISLIGWCSIGIPPCFRFIDDSTNQTAL
jgi:hypothetical protein